MSRTNYSDGRDESAEIFEPRSKAHHSKTRKKRSKKGKKNEILSTFVYIVVALAICLLIRQFLFAPVSVDGESMMPTLKNHDRLILNKIKKVDRFDIIVFPAPDAPDKEYIKRVIGLPGDEISMQDDVLYLNGKAVQEPYLDQYKKKLKEKGQLLTGDFTLMGKTGVAKVPENEYFVMGDNRGNSKDSRIFGFVHIDTISGTTDLRIWPFTHFGTLKTE